MAGGNSRCSQLCFPLIALLLAIFWQTAAKRAENRIPEVGSFSVPSKEVTPKDGELAPIDFGNLK
jgi:hypothetical protein